MIEKICLIGIGIALFGFGIAIVGLLAELALQLLKR